MNAITHLILHGVASGNVTLTPRVLGTLKALNHDWPDSKQSVLGKNHCGAPGRGKPNQVSPKFAGKARRKTTPKDQRFIWVQKL